MKLPAIVTSWLYRVEMLLVGPLPPDVRRNIYVDMRGACAASLMSVILGFLPIILRRQGASDELLALYYAITALGSVFVLCALLAPAGAGSLGFIPKRQRT